MRIKDITGLAHRYLKDFVTEGDIVIDATAGNGFDTFYLAELVGRTGHVYAFDLQKVALEKTRLKLDEEKLTARVTLIEAGHELLDCFVAGPVTAVIYNLGYFPGGDKQVTTNHATTLVSIEKATKMLLPGGIILVVVYPGHPEGLIEKRILHRFCKSLPGNRFSVLHTRLCNQKNNPPELLIIQNIY
jgi:predicted methyltransferase